MLLLADVTVVLAGDTVEFESPLAAVSVPVTVPLAAPDLTVAVNVFVFPAPTDSVVGERVITGVAFAIEQVND